MICLLYDLIFFLFALVSLPHFLVRLRQTSDPYGLLRTRWGWFSNEWTAKLDGREVIWIHAVSVGEVLGVKRFLESASERYPQYQFVLSVTTPTGFQVASQTHLSKVPIFYTPFDLSWVTRRVIRLIKPRILLLMETELWPNLITSAASHGVRIGLLNGRISPNSFRGYFAIRTFLRPLLKLFAFFAVQTEADRDRFLSIGAPRDRIFVVGSLKFDDVSEDISVDPQKLRDLLNIASFAKSGPGLLTPHPTLSPLGGEGLGEGEISDVSVLLAGSTHAGEEEFLLHVFRQLRIKHPNLLLILAPRHVERNREVEELVRKHEFKFGSFSNPVKQADVILIDVMGKLRELYSIADIVFMGGSLIKHGGQNPVEAIRFSRGVISGPFVHNFQKVYDILREAGAARIVHSREELYQVLDELLRDSSKRRRMGETARTLLLKLRGATKNHLKILDTLIREIDRSCNTISSPPQGERIKVRGKIYHPHPNPLPPKKGGRGDSQLRSCTLSHFTNSWLKRFIYSAKSNYLRVISGESKRWESRILHSLLIPFGFAYGATVSRLRNLYTRDILRRRKLPVPVVSIGNLTWGGTGKTPLVDYVTAYYLSRGRRVLILTRGYGDDEVNELRLRHPNAKIAVGKNRFKAACDALRAGSKSVIASDPKGRQKARAKQSDEILRFAQDDSPGGHPEAQSAEARLPSGQGSASQIAYPPNFGRRASSSPAGTPRNDVLSASLNRESAEIAILDDGFQHWRLRRNLDIVAINALNAFGNGCVIPAGSLREPVTSVRFAHLVVLTHVNLVDSEVLEELKSRLESCGAKRDHIVESIHEPQYFYRASSGERVPLGEVTSKRAIVFSGIGYPQSFEGTLRKTGLNIDRVVRFADHHPFSAEELRNLKVLSNRSEETITTEKDFLRSRELMIDTINPLILKIQIRITKGEDFLHARLDSLLDR